MIMVQIRRCICCWMLLLAFLALVPVLDGRVLSIVPKQMKRMKRQMQLMERQMNKLNELYGARSPAPPPIRTFTPTGYGDSDFGIGLPPGSELAAKSKPKSKQKTKSNSYHSDEISYGIGVPGKGKNGKDNSNTDDDDVSSYGIGVWPHKSKKRIKKKRLYTYTADQINFGIGIPSDSDLYAKSKKKSKSTGKGKAKGSPKIEMGKTAKSKSIKKRSKAMKMMGMMMKSKTKYSKLTPGQSSKPSTDPPSKQPTGEPSFLSPPVSSQQPSFQPSYALTTAPTLRPTSIHRTLEPTTTTGPPTRSPTLSPTLPVPTVKPTKRTTTAEPTPSSAPTTLAPTDQPSAPTSLSNAPTIAVQIIPIRDFFISYNAPAADRVPTPDEYALIKNLTDQFYTDYFRDYFVEDASVEFYGVESNLTITGWDLGIPEERFNIYVEYEMEVIFSEDSTPPDEEGLFLIMQEGTSIEYILGYVHEAVGTPFESTAEVFMEDNPPLNVPTIAPTVAPAAGSFFDRQTTVPTSVPSLAIVGVRLEESDKAVSTTRSAQMEAYAAVVDVLAVQIQEGLDNLFHNPFAPLTVTPSISPDLVKTGRSKKAAQNVFERHRVDETRTQIVSGEQGDDKTRRTKSEMESGFEQTGSEGARMKVNIQSVFEMPRVTEQDRSNLLYNNNHRDRRWSERSHKTHGTIFNMGKGGRAQQSKQRRWRGGKGKGKGKGRRPRMMKRFIFRNEIDKGKGVFSPHSGPKPVFPPSAISKEPSTPANPTISAAPVSAPPVVQTPFSSTVPPTSTPATGPTASPAVPTVQPITQQLSLAPSTSPTVLSTSAPTTSSAPTGSMAPSPNPTTTLSPTGEPVVQSIGEYYIAYAAPGARREPTDEEYNLILDNTNEYFNIVFETFFFSDPDVKVIRVNSAVVETLYEAEIPQPRFNIYMRFDSNVTYTSDSEPFSVFETFDGIMAPSINPEYIVEWVRTATGTPFESTNEVFMGRDP